jgi:hypothetical protein
MPALLKFPERSGIPAMLRRPAFEKLHEVETDSGDFVKRQIEA